MCYYIDSETVIANIFNNTKNKSISLEDVNSFCIKAYQHIRQKNQNAYVYFDVTYSAIEQAVRSSEYFELFLDKLFLKASFDINEFNSNLDNIVRDALTSVAK